VDPAYLSNIFDGTNILFFAHLISVFLQIILFFIMCKRYFFFKASAQNNFAKYYLLLGAAFLSSIFFDLFSAFQNNFVQNNSVSFITSNFLIGDRLYLYDALIVIFLFSKYLFLSFFLDSLLSSNQRTRNIFKYGKLLCLLLLGFLFGGMIMTSNIYFVYENFMKRTIHFLIIFIMISIAYQTFVGLRKILIANSMLYQIKSSFSILLISYLLFDFFQNSSIAFTGSKIGGHPTVTISFRLLSILFYLCAAYLFLKKLFTHKLLSSCNRAKTSEKLSSLDHHKKIFSPIAKDPNFDRPSYTIQQLFSNLFAIPYDRIEFIIYGKKTLLPALEGRRIAIENFIGDMMPTEFDYLYEKGLIIKDNLEFESLYDDTPEQQVLIKFLDASELDIFLPIYNKKKEIIAYITVEQDARPKLTYRISEMEDMVTVSRYLSRIIDMLNYHYTDGLLEENRDLNRAVYALHQENKQYEESIHSFVHEVEERKIGLIYKKVGEKFINANIEAEELLGCNINKDKNHSLTKAVEKLVLDVKKYKGAQTIALKVLENRELVMRAVPILDGEVILIIIYRRDVADEIKLKLGFLKDSSEWNFLLYLETTEAGMLLSRLIPGSGKLLLEFKINLLKVALSRKPILLNVPADDLKAIIGILHSVTLRQNIYMIKLTAPEKDFEISKKLFGINPLFLADPKGSCRKHA